MKEQDYELLSQYLDGELAGPEAQVVRERLLAEPQLRATFERLRSVNNRVAEAFNAPGVETVPAQVTALLDNAETRGNPGTQARRAGWGLAVAASLLAAAGLLLAPDWRQPAGEDPQLAELLEHTPSRGQGWDTLPDGRQVRPLLSFQNKTGGWCREYLVSDAGITWRGVACRSAGNWSTEVLAAAQRPGTGSEYRPASAGDSDEIASFISTHAADIAISLEQEASIIARQWQ